MKPLPHPSSESKDMKEQIEGMEEELPIKVRINYFALLTSLVNYNF